MVIDERVIPSSVSRQQVSSILSNNGELSPEPTGKACSANLDHERRAHFINTRRHLVVRGRDLNPPEFFADISRVETTQVTESR